MSTEYAVPMDFRDFLAAAKSLGFNLEVVNENGYNRLRLVDGSPLGYVYDPREELANDGKTWTLFTRYGLNDVSGLVVPLGAVDEHGAAFGAIYGDKFDRAQANIVLAASELFEGSAVEGADVFWLLGKVLEAAQWYRALTRDWAIPDEQGPLPVVVEGENA